MARGRGSFQDRREPVVAVQGLKRVVDTLARDTAYPGLFARAFGDREVTEQRIAKALAQFVRSLVSYQSRYDEGRARAPSAQSDFDHFTLKENRGKALFMRNCGTCHMKDGNEHFFVPTPANTGLRGDDPKAEGGVGDVTLRAEDLGSFKSPSLRNVEVTAPYGHDGRFATLDALIDHYSDNAIFDPNVGYRMPVGPLKFTASEKAALIAFLKTLTDRTFLTDPLPPAKHAPALQIVLALQLSRNANDSAADALRKDLKALLDDEEYENFLAAATRLSGSGNLPLRNVETHVIRRPLLPR